MVNTTATPVRKEGRVVVSDFSEEGVVGMIS